MLLHLQFTSPNLEGDFQKSFLRTATTRRRNPTSNVLQVSFWLRYPFWYSFARLFSSHVASYSDTAFACDTWLTFWIFWPITMQFNWFQSSRWPLMITTSFLQSFTQIARNPSTIGYFTFLSKFHSLKWTSVVSVLNESTVLWSP